MNFLYLVIYSIVNLYICAYILITTRCLVGHDEPLDMYQFTLELFAATLQ